MSTRFTTFLKGAEDRLRADSKAVGEALEHHGEIGAGRDAEGVPSVLDRRLRLASSADGTSLSVTAVKSNHRRQPNSQR